MKKTIYLLAPVLCCAGAVAAQEYQPAPYSDEAIVAYEHSSFSGRPASTLLYTPSHNGPAVHDAGLPVLNIGQSTDRLLAAAATERKYPGLSINPMPMLPVTDTNKVPVPPKEKAPVTKPVNPR